MRIIEKVAIFERFDNTEKVRLYLDGDGDPVFECGVEIFYLDRDEFREALAELGFL